MYLELTRPEHTQDYTFIIVKVLNDDGTPVQICTSTAERLDSTITFMTEQFQITGIIDKRFK